MKYWTEAEDSFLRDNRRALSIEELAFRLGRSKHSIWNRLDKLGSRASTIDRIDENLPQSSLGYIAAAIDCDGWIGIWPDLNRKNVVYFTRVAVTNTSREMIDRIAQWLGIKTIDGGHFHKNHDGFRSNKPQYTLYIHRMADILQLLTLIEPLLIRKRKQSELVREFCSLRLKKYGHRHGEKERELYLKVKELNRYPKQRGIPTKRMILDGVE